MKLSFNLNAGPLWLGIAAGAFLLVFLGASLPIDAQAVEVENQAQQTYRFPLAVNEVVLTFHALDLHRLPVNDLKRDEIRVFDNELPARRIVAFDSALDRPIRAGILIDTSESMQLALPQDKILAERFVQRIFRQASDQAFVMDFGYSSEFAQSWTNNPNTLSMSVQNVQAGRMNPLGGTAIFDTIFRACLYGFGKIGPASSSNFILLFSDGEDNASHSTVEEALNACQKSNTAIYAFSIPPPPGRDSLGPMTLAELASRSGGRVFPAVDTEDAIWQNLRTIESEIRNQYRLVYDPVRLKHDGSFHRIAILPPDRVTSISVRSGYYAPSQ
jgi:Ca-activated chloride channel family protein